MTNQGTITGSVGEPREYRVRLVPGPGAARAAYEAVSSGRAWEDIPAETRGRWRAAVNAVLEQTAIEQIEQGS